MKGIEPAFTLLADPAVLSDRRRRKLLKRMFGGDKAKLTWSGRLADLDALVATLVAERFAPGAALTVHDLGVSTAVTSVDFYRRLVATGRSVRFSASDRYDVLRCVRLWGVSFVFDAEDGPLQAAIGRVGVSARRGVWGRLFAPFWPAATRRLAGARTLSLFDAEAVRLAASDPAFRLAREDCMQPDAGQYDIVRLANVIPKDASPARRRAAAEAVSRLVADRGLFVVGGSNDFSILQRSGDRLVEIAILGTGFRIAGTDGTPVAFS